MSFGVETFCTFREFWFSCPYFFVSVEIPKPNCRILYRYANNGSRFKVDFVSHMEPRKWVGLVAILTGAFAVTLAAISPFKLGTISLLISSAALFINGSQLSKDK